MAADNNSFLLIASTQADTATADLVNFFMFSYAFRLTKLPCLDVTQDFNHILY